MISYDVKECKIFNNYSKFIKRWRFNMFKKHNYIILAVILTMIMTVACSKESSHVDSSHVDLEDNASYYTFTDSLGNTVVLEEAPKG